MRDDNDISVSASSHLMLPTAIHSRSVQPAHAERIVLTGFMGSGKSTVGALLAAELGWKFQDLDSLIEQRTSMSISEIFSRLGEQAFRREETAALAAALRQNRAVLALGGGAPETLANRLLLEKTPATAVVFLYASFVSLQSRCASQSADPTRTVRPLFSDPVDARSRFEMRQPLYRRLAHLAVETTDQTPGQTVLTILTAVEANHLFTPSLDTAAPVRRIVPGSIPTQEKSR